MGSGIPSPVHPIKDLGERRKLSHMGPRPKMDLMDI